MTIPDLTTGRLTPMVRRVLGAPDVRVVECWSEPLGVDRINPLTFGLYRVGGTAQAGRGPARPWRVILKVVHLPDFSGTPLESGYATRPEDWNYWRREVLALDSGLLDRFTWPLRPVRCWGTEDIDELTSWLWLEELDSTPRRPTWSLEELAASAYDWGSFSAQGAAMVDEVESLPWTARRFLTGWLETARALGAEHAIVHGGCWNHPLLRDRLPASAQLAFAELMEAAGRLLDRLNSLPRTVAHHDTQWNNLFSERTPQGHCTVAIDWSFFGTAPVGADLGHHVASNVLWGGVEPSEATRHEETATEAYLDGLHANGWRGHQEDVRFAAAATGALQQLSFAVCHIAMLCPDFDEVERWPEEMAEQRSSDLDTVMDTWCEAFRYLLTLGERARHSLGRT